MREYYVRVANDNPVNAENVSVVKLAVEIENLRNGKFFGEHYLNFEVSGVAVKHPEDKNDPDVGIALATARALRKAAKRLDRMAWGQIKHKDDIRALKTKPKKVKLSKKGK